MHVVIRVTSIPNMHVDLRLFLNILVFKTSHEKGELLIQAQIALKNGDDLHI